MFAKLLSRTFLGLFLLVFVGTQASAAGIRIFKFAQKHAAPLTALQEAAKLMDQRGGPIITQPELDIFKKIAAGRPEQCDTVDTLLTVSKIKDPKQRQLYTQKINTIVEGARKTLKGFTKDTDKAAVLAHYLQEHWLLGGYVDGQFEIVPLLNKGTYNCVSSAVIYFTVGEQLGIKMTPENAPVHVFLRMGNVSIEPTSGLIYYPEEHEKNFDELWAEAGPVEKLLFSNKQYQPLDKMGLIGMIYYNRSIAQAAHDDQAAATVLKACCMYPKSPEFENQAGAYLYNWIVDCVNGKDIVKGRKIATIFGQLYGDSEAKKYFGKPLGI
ncbi:MAG TPA: transglutaminase family protein [Lacipirellulaceae bacterium]|jgi:regulator of sirC expression with transglutaminase-like and TPR domain|nr:transglutaminase family protein [Lacipirellulaceae bacterium]